MFVLSEIQGEFFDLVKSGFLGQYLPERKRLFKMKKNLTMQEKDKEKL